MSVTRGPHTSHSSPARAQRLVSLLAVVAIVCAIAVTCASSVDRRESPSPRDAATPAAAAPGADVDFAPAAATQGADYSRFTHSNPNHSRLPCLLCHRREDAGARPRRSGHTPCAGCHAPQFADQQHPICTICHTNPPSPALKAFPPLRSFGSRFDHAVHTRGAARPQNNCATCHRPSRRGVALSIPTGAAAHATCYQCHASRAQGPGGRDLSSCGLCHQPGRLVRTPEMAAAYRVNFSHAEHTRARLSCNDCHTVRAGAARGRQVTSPQPLMHHASPRAQSCMTCHNDKRAFGGDDFSDCKRCHEGNTWRF